MRRLAVVLCVVSIIVLVVCSADAAQQELKPGSERLRDVSESGVAYISLILSLILVLLGPAVVVWIVCRVMRLEEVGALRALYCALLAFLVSLLLFYRLELLTNGLDDWTQFYKVWELGLRAGAVVIICFIIFKFFMRVSAVGAVIFTFFYVVSFYIAVRLAYSFLERTGGIDFLKFSQQ
jgi:hypothetical protein